MKNLSVLIAGLFVLLSSFSASGQVKTGADFFIGKWNVLVKGTPNGDTKIFVVLEKKDSTLAGVVLDSSGNEMSRIDNIELKDSSITVYFKTQGYDVNLV